jgi:hypothetical protein
MILCHAEPENFNTGKFQLTINMHGYSGSTGCRQQKPVHDWRVRLFL